MGERSEHLQLFENQDLVVNIYVICSYLKLKHSYQLFSFMTVLTSIHTNNIVVNFQADEM